MTQEALDLALARLTLVKSALAAAAPGAAPALPPSLEIVGKRRRLDEIPPVAFLAHFNATRPPPSAPGGPPPGPVEIGSNTWGSGSPSASSAPNPEVEGVFLLKPGVNLVGHNEHFADFQRPQYHSMESRQWLVLIPGDRAYVADHGSTNQSLVLPRSAARLAERDPRFDPHTTGFGAPRGGMIALDAAGNTAVELSEGDVLITYRAAFVFGWVPRAR